ncbi:two-component system histidine kinase PnpS [Bacillus sp. Marseille-P3661]|uniref:two-component system histidine kinase PnpS n=1 Tax=Bacillus sp. Marseille-P3661 TaxID=1936234 RepID=UPI000C83473C|nr:ATP-binding protein [Bacillus sp. Marseille-P3661]
MSEFKTKIIFSLSFLILTVLVALGFLLGQLFKNFYINTFEERMDKEANLIISLIANEDIRQNTVDQIIKEVSASLDAGVTIVLPDGKSVVESNEALELDNILADIPELEGMLIQKQTNFEGFHVLNEKTGIFHYVIPFRVQNEFKGYLILTLSVDPLKNINQIIWGLLITSFAIAFILILMLGLRITSEYTKPIESATRVARELAKGNYKARTYEDRAVETGMLSQSINILARNLQQMTAAQEMQQDRLRTLIESMGSGLILIDGKGYINLVNKFYLETFDVKPEEYLYRLYYDAFTHQEIIELVETIFITENAIRKQIKVPIRIERKNFEVYGAPIIGINEEWKGVVLVFHDITELKRLESIRNDFVANVSHELKTPMTSIKGFSETLLDGAAEEPELREYFLGIILKETDRLQSLVNDLLDLSKIEQEGFKLNLSVIDISEIVRDVVIILESIAEEKEISLISNVETEQLFIFADQHRIKQILINLINNAINYTPPEGSIEVFVLNLENEIKISIVDTGIGIAKEHISRIFERFYRVDKARSRNSGGTGLGLAIVKHLVEAHQGRIEVESEIGKGTTFSVILPKYN